ncbi:hypothetical protein AAFF_G00350150 [Aldrovandia affinis]|uniref:Uncharacterized protein n=1 Tax=Aldrovandia affinis TaxID=143900 RepID=A0AAD7SJG8_9TELE|nr:hypothetical protein AAFF_G00350150 [Aldrovandia affinis]
MNKHVRSWLAAGKRPEWADVVALDTETKAFHSQWGGLETRDGVLYRRWRAPGRGADLMQLLVPRSLRTQPAAEAADETLRHHSPRDSPRHI